MRLKLECPRLNWPEALPREWPLPACSMSSVIVNLPAGGRKPPSFSMLYYLSMGERLTLLVLMIGLGRCNRGLVDSSLSGNCLSH